MKNKVLLIIFTLICSVIYADTNSLFDYRGMFSADHKSDAIITNYMLIKRPVSVKFQFETPDAKIEDRVKLIAVLLTSNQEVAMHNEKGIATANLPEPGIYELKIASNKGFDGEVKFILKVYEQKKIAEPVKLAEPSKASETDKVAKREKTTEPKTAAVNDSIAEPEKVIAKDLNLVRVPKKTQFSLSDATIIGEVPDDDDTIMKNSPPVASTVLEGIIDTPNFESISDIEKNATGSREISFLASSTNKEEDVTMNPNTIVLVEPSENSFINPYNGFRFEVKGQTTTDTVQLKEFINITLWKKTGGKEAVKGSFYSEGPGSITFLPSEIIDGAIYHVETLDIKTKQPANSISCTALPLVSGRIISNSNDFVIQLTWEQNLDLLPNSNGQIIRLTNMVLTVLSASGTELLDLKLNEHMPPVAYVNGCKIQGAPYQLVLTIPSTFEGNVIHQILSVLTCKMSGNTSQVEVLKLKSEISSNLLNTNIDFSNVTALPRDAEGTINENTVATLAKLGDNVSFKLSKVFDICNDEKLSKVIWPQDICWDGNGNIWVLDSQRRKIYNFTENGRLILEFGEKGNSPGKLGFPTGLIYKDGFLFVADMRNHCVHKFLLDGTYSGLIPSVPGTKSELKLPSGLCFRNKEMWITDKEAGRVLCFNAGKTYLGGFSLKSLKKNSLPLPISIRAASETLYILQKNGSVSLYSPMGKFIREVIGETRKERSISVTNAGYLYVAEPDEAKVKRYSSNGNLLQTLELPQDQKPWMPVCIAQRDDGKLVVADAKNKQIYIFQVIAK